MSNIVEVSWIDAWHNSEEITLEQADSLCPIRRRQVGYILKQSKDVVVIAGSIYEKIPDGVDSFADIVIIPACVVKQPIRVLE